MTITKREHQKLNKLLEDIENVLSVKEVTVDEKRVEKGLSFHRPIIADCLIAIEDGQFSGLELRYFPLDWKWGEPPEFLRGRVFLNRLFVSNPLPTLVKPPFRGGTGILTIEGNEEVKVRTGFMKSRFVDYRFKAPGRYEENKTLVERINSDPDLMKALKKEFSIAEGRPLPHFKWADSSLLPLGEFDIFDIENEKEKMGDSDFWKVDDPETVNKVVNRMEVLRRLPIYLQKGKAPLQKQNPPSTHALLNIVIVVE